MIEQLPMDLRDRFTEMREMDLQVQSKWRLSLAPRSPGLPRASPGGFSALLFPGCWRRRQAHHSLHTRGTANTVFVYSTEMTTLQRSGNSRAFPKVCT